MASKQKGYEQQKVGYKNPPKANQWKAGQSGNPSGKKKGVKKLPSTLFEKIEAQLHEIKKISMNGKTKQLPMMDILVGRMIHNLVNAPLPQQIDALAKLINMGAINPDFSPFLEDDGFDMFTEEDRRFLKMLKDEIDQGALGDWTSG